MKILVIGILSIIALVPDVRAQAIWTGPPGGGMLGVQEPWIARLGHGGFGFVLDNYDRDPLGPDIDEVRMSLRIGIGHGLELYGSWYGSRAVTVPGAHPLPSPPVDIIIASGSIPTPPYRATYWPLPYLAVHSSSVSDFIPGDFLFGIKRMLWQERKLLPAFSLSANAILPASKELRNLHRGSGSGSIDLAIHTATAWTPGHWTIVANLGYIRSGRLPYEDRIITADRIFSNRLRRPDFIRIATGVRYRIDTHVSLMTEMFHMPAIGSRTLTEDSVSATDVLAGIQFNFSHLVLTGGYRQHLRPPPTGMLRPTGPLAGAVNLTHVPKAQQDAYLTAIGVSPDSRRSKTALIVSGAPPDVLLPAEAYRLPPTYLTSTTGNGGVVLMIAWKF